ncbi:MAG: hypothetical protein RQ745_06210 [Longimicrobiales bacterium]|nr:hypothetical protein [Longimicrobiales bacterium]
MAVLSLAFLGYFARVLPKPVLGFIGVQAALVVLAKIAVDLGLHFQVLREATPLFQAGREAEAVERVVAPATLLRLAAAFALAGLIVAVGYAFADTLQDAVPEMNIRLALPFACGHILFKIGQHVLTPIFHARGEFWLDSVLDSGSATVEKIFAFAFFTVAGVDHFFTGMMVGQIVTLALAAWFLRRTIRRFRLSHLTLVGAAERVRRAFPHYQRVLYRRGLRQVDRLFVAGMLPMTQMANYHVARQGTQFLRYVVRSLADPVTQRLAAADWPHGHRRDHRVYHTIVIAVPLAVAAASPWLIRALGGAAYADSWDLMAALAVSFIFYGLSEYQLSVLAILGDGSEPVHIEAVSGVVGLVATAAMIAWMGEIGAAAGRIVQFLLLYLGGRVVTRRLLAGARAQAEAEAAERR